MKKIIVIGCPGSGKSTFSRALSEKTGISVYHLDMMYWNENKTTVEKSVFLDRLSSVLSFDEWIVDGNFSSTMELRIAACDTVIFLDLPVDVCIEGIRERLGKPRSDMPWIETEEDAEFIEFVRSFESQVRPTIIKLLEKYSDKMIVIFKTRQQMNDWLQEL